MEPPEIPLAISVMQQRTDCMPTEGYFFCIADRRRYVPRSLGIESYRQRSYRNAYKAAARDDYGWRRGGFEMMSLNEFANPGIRFRTGEDEPGTFSRDISIMSPILCTSLYQITPVSTVNAIQQRHTEQTAQRKKRQPSSTARAIPAPPNHLNQQQRHQEPFYRR
jgi:hypothetical protein